MKIPGSIRRLHDDQFDNNQLLKKKVDELVRILNLKVFKPSQELLTISDVTDTRKSLLD